jgi:type I restriction enzyme S subunit
MKPARLLAQFGRISEAPDAVPRLRHSILELAVRGKLVNQDREDGPVPSRYFDEPVSEELPATWRLLNFARHCDIQGGNQPPKSQFIDEPRKGYVRLFQIRDLGDNPVPVYIPEGTTNRFCLTGDILIGRYGASVGKIFWAQNGAYNVALAKFLYPADAFLAQFAFLMLKSSFFQSRLTDASRSAQAGFNKGDLAEVTFPLPPLAEQRRIVAKVDQLMALCDRVEAAQAERECWRNRLVAASLHRLNEPADAPDFREHAQFYLRHLPRLATRPEHLQQLRQTILNLAARGKLAPQDPSDEPASRLLRRIEAEKGRLAKEEGIKCLRGRLESRLGAGWVVQLPSEHGRTEAVSQ